MIKASEWDGRVNGRWTEGRGRVTIPERRGWIHVWILSCTDPTHEGPAKYAQGRWASMFGTTATTHNDAAYFLGDRL